MSKSKEKAALRAEAIANLRKRIRPGSTVWIQLVHVARSGMSRDLRVFIVRGGEIVNVTWYVGHACGDRIADRDGQRVIRVGGCGFDAGFQVVYDLGRVLFPRGGVAGKSTRAHAVKGRETDGGYLLRKEWI